MSETKSLETDIKAMQLYLKQIGSHRAQVLQASAVPHRFDKEFLAALLVDVQSSSGTYQKTDRFYKDFQWLIKRPFVKPPTTNKDVPPNFELHERQRSSLLAILQKKKPNKYHLWSKRAKDFCESRMLATDSATSMRREYSLERIYHWLAVEEESAFNELTVTYDELESRQDFQLCNYLLTLAQEQSTKLRDDRFQCLQYYRGRLSARTNYLKKAFTDWDPLLAETISPRVRLLLATELMHIPNHLDFYRQFKVLDQPDNLRYLGVALQALGEYPAAISCYRQAGYIFYQLGNLQQEAVVLNRIGACFQALASWPDAIASYEKVLDLALQLQSRVYECIALKNIGGCYLEQNESNRARDALARAFDIAVDLGEQEQMQSIRFLLDQMNR